MSKTTPTITQTIAALESNLGQFAAIAVAVSGGIDSLTLATLVGRRYAERAEMFHAVSAAVPPETTTRVRQRAIADGWRLKVIDAGEFDQPKYIANPVNRCFFCKQSLYTTIAGATNAQILSGTNLDDLADYRPGLEAARDAGVRHPYAELGIGKTTIREIARQIGLGALAELPASPCLASRVETGTRISAELLRWIHAVENVVRERVAANAIRCRMRGDGVVIEIDPEVLDAMSDAHQREIAAAVGALGPLHGVVPQPSFAPYRRGSAFLLAHD